MNGVEFAALFENQIEDCKNVLLGKAKEYATDDDRLSNFKQVAAFRGISPEQALAGMIFLS